MKKTEKALRTKSSAVERILETASDLFRREGIRAVGVDTIVERAGVAKMTLYKHFGGKDELVAAYLRARDERWRTSLREITDRYTDPERRLLAVFDAYGQWLVGDDFRGCSFVNATAEFADPSHPARAVARAHKEGLRKHLAAAAAEAGVQDPDTLADQLLILLEGATVTAAIRRSSEPLHSARAVAELLVA